MKKILVIGSANIDMTICTDRMPALGETVTGRDFALNCGGKGANQAVAVAKLGGNVQFLGAVGDDVYGERLLSEFKKYNISFEGIKTQSAPTGTAIITVVDGDNFIILDMGANGCVTPELIEEKADLIRNADYLIMQLEIPVESVIRAAQLAKEADTAVIINPAPYKELPDEIFALTDMIIPNEHEAKLLTGIGITDDKSCENAINSLKNRGVKDVIITLGENGCAYSGEDSVEFRPAQKTKAVDTTSAGDSFIGALICRLAEGDSMSDAINYATRVAAITVSRHGASISIPFKEEIK